MLSIALSIVSLVAFSAFFLSARKLGPERLAQPTEAEWRRGWVPGTFTPAGQRLRSRLTAVFVLGVACLIAALAV